MNKISSLLIMLFISSCASKIQNSIGVTSSGPNEYKVMRNKQLDIPPQYNQNNTFDKKDTKNLQTLKLDDLPKDEMSLLEDIIR